MEKELPFAKAKSPEHLLVEVLFHFSILMEYQLIDLQANVRSFVEAMSDAIQKMDHLVVEEGREAQEIFENLFVKTNQEGGLGGDEAVTLNQRANARADSIFAEALGQKLADSQKEGSTGHLWSDISKKFESVSRLEERLRPQVYTMIQSLNFEDIQTQRIEHALMAQKALNEGIVHFLKKGLQNCSMEEILVFSQKLVKETRQSYTMADERHVFDQIFYEVKKEEP
jgi:hypothetical protein